ncbi:hypothetical protein F7725_007329 [Dissostichus mawsoni]|uniref:HAT C-terminal dimerisation domain-containing protein n=1 Tax=Dissostichus mawsoni TaxID=36200 RepID=A0A7J5XY62_DISMA|nr:hypothetical protein F7725_007329 [Dissostichus mawsoni]
MVVPAASAEAERSFSALRRLKTWLRSTMMQIRINNVAVCHIHKELLGKVSREKICQEFILANEYRKHGKKEIKKNAKTGKHDEMKASQKQQMLTGSMRSMRSEPTGGESEMLAELRKLRQENSESFKDTKLSINRLESSMTEIKQQIEQLDERITTAENKVSAMEDRSIRQERALFLATGVRVFPTLVEAQSTLKELGVDARVEERDILERELTQDKWSTQENWRRNQMQLNPTDRYYESGNRASRLLAFQLRKTQATRIVPKIMSPSKKKMMLPFLGQKSWRKLGVENEWMKCTRKCGQ